MKFIRTLLLCNLGYIAKHFCFDQMKFEKKNLSSHNLTLMMSEGTHQSLRCYRRILTISVKAKNDDLEIKKMIDII